MSEASSGAGGVEAPSLFDNECLMPEIVREEMFSSVSTLLNPGRETPFLIGVVDPDDSGVIGMAIGAISDSVMDVRSAAVKQFDLISL